MSSAHRFIRACQSEPVDQIPVWLMRQAGRYLPEYRRVRGRNSFLTLCKTPSLAVEITLQPLERFGLDAAILFSDILVLLEAMGIELRFEESVGPVLGRTVAQSGDVAALGVPDPEQELGYVMEAIRQIQAALDGRVPLIGFSGAPFTLATYMIEGGSTRNFYKTKRFMFQEPAAFHRLMETLASAAALYLKAQIAAGVNAVQVFDTWATILSPHDYREFVLPYMQQLFESINAGGVPTIHFSLGASTLLPEMQQIGARVLGLDWKIDIGQARQLLGPDQPVQGNMDPFALFKPAGELEAAARSILEKGACWNGYIFNIGHGIHPKVPVESVQRLIETVQNFPVPGAGGKSQ